MVKRGDVCRLLDKNQAVLYDCKNKSAFGLLKSRARASKKRPAWLRNSARSRFGSETSAVRLNHFCSYLHVFLLQMDPIDIGLNATIFRKIYNKKNPRVEDDDPELIFYFLVKKVSTRV